MFKTLIQDLAETNNTHTSVLVHEMTVVEPPLNGSIFSESLVYSLRFSLDLLNSVDTTLFLMILLGVIYRLVKIHQRLHRFMIVLFINWGPFLVPWVTGLKFIKLRLKRTRNEVT